MNMKCPKCNKDVKVYLTRDRRGIPEAHCEECKSYIKKFSTTEALDYYDDLMVNNINRPQTVRVETVGGDEDKRLPCKMCGENFFVRYGRLGTVYTPIEAQFCPVCGRKLREDDRKY